MPETLTGKEMLEISVQLRGTRRHDESFLRNRSPRAQFRKKSAGKFAQEGFKKSSKVRTRIPLKAQLEARKRRLKIKLKAGWEFENCFRHV